MRTKASGESTLLLVDAVQVLRAAQVDYAIIGAMAASVHGVIRASRDADALLSITASALPDLERSFRAAGFKTELRRGDMDDPISAVLTLHDEFENRVDLLVGIRGFDPQAFSRAIDGTPACVRHIPGISVLEDCAARSTRRTSLGSGPPGGRESDHLTR